MKRKYNEEMNDLWENAIMDLTDSEPLERFNKIDDGILEGLTIHDEEESDLDELYELGEY